MPTHGWRGGLHYFAAPLLSTSITGCASSILVTETEIYLRLMHIADVNCRAAGNQTGLQAPTS
jgi:hypothetical protein